MGDIQAIMAVLTSIAIAVGLWFGISGTVAATKWLVVRAFRLTGKSPRAITPITLIVWLLLAASLAALAMGLRRA